MKLYKKLFILSLSTLLFTGCSGENDDTNIDESLGGSLSPVQIDTKKEIDDLKKEIARLEEELENKNEKTEEPLEEAITDTTLGSRSKPIPVGETLSLKATLVDRDADYEEFDAKIDVTITSSIRGEDAWNILLEENQFNDPAPEGKEYIINEVEIRLFDATSDDLKTLIRKADFDYISSAGASYPSVYVVTPNELRVELYNNGSATGNIVGLVDKDDAPLIRYEKSFFMESQW